MKRYARFACAVLAAAMLAACGASPTAGTAFKAPAGWQATPAMFGFQLWMNNADKGEMLMLMKSPKSMPLDQFAFNPSMLQSQVNGAKVEKAETVAICGNQPAKLLSVVGESKAGKTKESVEVLATDIGKKTYVAMYMHPATTKANRDAESAIRSLCAAPK